MAPIIPVILCGGSGTRLWPLSRKSFPKQFVPLIQNKSLLQLTLERVSHLGPNLICVTSEEHRFMVADAMRTAKVQGKVLLEPVSRNTAAAMALAALAAEPNDMLLFCPSDHHIPDHEEFCRVVKQATISAQQGTIVIFGVPPTYPSTAYGYAQKGPARKAGTFRVDSFTEKPSPSAAEALISSGNTYWNAGIFLCVAKTLISALAQHAPDILENCELAMAAAAKDGNYFRPQSKTFAKCRSESIDFAIMEHYSNVELIPFNGMWSDVGSWNSVASLTQPDMQGNRIQGKGRAPQSQNTFVHAPHRLVVALGTRDLMIVDTPDALLVADASYGEQVKQVVAELDGDNISETIRHRRVARPWGSYDSVDLGERHQVKRIIVHPGERLSLQMHYHRAEHWIIVKGTALITRGDEEMILTENQSTFIPVGIKHRLENTGKIDLELIEVQSGSYLAEDDIIRFEDNYGRK